MIAKDLIVNNALIELVFTKHFESKKISGMKVCTKLTQNIELLFYIKLLQISAYII